MAFLAPIIIGAVGMTGAGAALASIALGVGLSFAANKIRGKQQKQGPIGAAVGLTIDTNAPRQLIVGETSHGGSLAFWHLSGANNERLWLVIALADYECTSLEGVIVAGKRKGWNAGTGEVADYNGKLKVRFYSGAAGQTADAALVAASGGRWTVDEVGTGVCYVVVEAVYSETLFPSGIPEYGFIVRGSKFLDDRTGTTAYSANATVALRAILRGVSVAGQPLIGMGTPNAAVRPSESNAAANICDELVPLKAGGSEARYRCNCVLDSTTNNQGLIETILASMGGELIESGGIYRIFAGAARTPVANLTDADFISDSDLSFRPKKGRAGIVNAVYGSYIDPTRLYAPIGLAQRTSTSDETLDGGRRYPMTLDLTSVTSRTQAQRLLELERRRARRPGILEGRNQPSVIALEPGDWVTITSARRGFVAKSFELESAASSQRLEVDAVWQETDSDVDYWTTSLEIDDGQVIDLPPAGPPSTAITGLAAVAQPYATGSGQVIPTISITWAQVTDPTAVRIIAEYRRVGDTVAMTATVIDPSATSYVISDGILSGTQYEVRLRIETRPERATTWAAWTAVSSPTDTAVIPISLVSNFATDVADGSITHPKLSDQARIELALLSAREDAAASVASQVSQVRADFARVATAILDIQTRQMTTGAFVRRQEVIRQTDTESFAKSLVEINAGLATAAANLATEQTARANGDSAEASARTDMQALLQGQIDNKASSAALTSEASTRASADSAEVDARLALQSSLQTQIDGKASSAALASEASTRASADSAEATARLALTSVVDGNTATIGVMQGTINGIKAYIAITLDVNGRFGFFKMDGTGSEISTILGSDKFRIVSSSVNGGTPVLMFDVQNIDGTPRFVMPGDVYVQKVVAGAIETVHLKAGKLVAPRLENVANTNWVDLSTGALRLG